MTALWLKNLFELAYLFARQNPWRVALVVGLQLLASLSSGISLLLLLPLLTAAGIPLAIDSSGASGFGFFAPISFFLSFIESPLIAVLGVYLFLVGGSALLNYQSQVKAASLQADFVSRLRHRLYSALLEARWIEIRGKIQADIQRMVLEQVQAVGLCLSFMIKLGSQALLILVYLCLALLISPSMTLLAGGLAVLLIALTYPMQHRIRATGEKHLHAYQDIYASVTEQLANLKIIKSHNAETDFLGRIDESGRDFDQQQVQLSRFMALTRFINLVGGALAFALFTWVFLKAGHIPAENFLILLILYARIMPQVSSAQSLLQSTVHLLPRYQDLKKTLLDFESAREETHLGSFAGSLPLNHSLQLENLFFHQRETNKELFNGLNLEIKAGEVIALTGQSGVGKSTLLDIISGLMQPTSGEIRIDGQLLNETNLRLWRKSVAYVTQEPLLFRSSIRDNLTWASGLKPNDTDIWACLKKTAADQWVSSLPSGLDTLIGDRATKISGGERQKLALTRALLSQPSLLILDEATNALDRDSEEVIKHTLRNMAGRTTIILVAHSGELLELATQKVRLPIKESCHSTPDASKSPQILF